MNSAVYWGQLMHNRIRPRKHRFSYRVASWLIDLDELSSLDKHLKLFSVDRFNLLSFYQKDFGDGSGRDLKVQTEELLAAHDVPAPSQTLMFCYPRVLGYAFNPLTVYYCFSSDQKLLSLIYEVTNTFGERHSYVIPAEKAEEGQMLFHQAVEKKLHVSPFFKTDCQYGFRVQLPGKTMKLAINLNDADGKLFAAVFKGDRQVLSDFNILRQLLVLPLQAIKVILAIHWEALRLFLKGVKVVRHVPKDRFFSWSRGWAGHPDSHEEKAGTNANSARKVLSR
ncbi:DUF1365 domain-containing protein [Endozoicomonas arenosclerae]|uniref:DUF1365 domain-containing protein n=1 Tax=Endozoicomonas arenosclerae TaxID=1633495 RepID=UPI00078408A4|nr:DUF1365 domain-containing protein [Endozoicomonas arenosclerae]